MAPTAFLPPSAPFLPRSRAPPRSVSHRITPVAQANPFDSDFTLPHSSSTHTSQSSKAASNLSVGQRRTEFKRREQSAAAAAKDEDEDAERREEMAGEKISSADLFGIVDMPRSERAVPVNGKSVVSTANSASDKIRRKPKAKVSAKSADKAQEKPRKKPREKLKHSTSALSAPAPVSPIASRSEVASESRRRRVLPVKAEDKTLRIQDLVSHAKHGIGRFRGLERTSVKQAGPGRCAIQEYAVLEYRDGDVYVPLSHLELVRKLNPAECKLVDKLDLISGASSFPSRIGRRKKSSYAARCRTRSKIRQQLVNLHGLYAQRSTLQREPFPINVEKEREFCDACSFALTPDQEVATSQVLSDMSVNPRPMDRLLCGDVGFGKTEVALRAAFRALAAGRQVAILAPTTILAQQHFETFLQRFNAYEKEITVACLTRFVSRKVVMAAREKIATGELRVAIGTHMMLNDHFKFEDLGLLIVDEEHRFGVNQKEKIRARYRGVDTLFLSATPIPRTLHLALSGLRDASVLRTPPPGRKPVITRVYPSGAGVVREAIGREMQRGGQTFFVVPRIEGIEAAAEWVEQLFPTLRVLIAHGSIADLERRIWSFAQHEYDVLVCTTIIENGINMPRVNTVIIQDAGRFGLAQLHQLRGRVGRSDVQAFAWILHCQQNGPNAISALDRLRALETYSDLGSGFAIAQRDMEMRGVGTVLGVEQHGNSTVGSEEYAKMLSEELEHARTGKPIPISLPVAESVEVFLPVASFIPGDYIQDADEKMSAYGLLSGAKKTRTLRAIARNMQEQYGELPAPTRRHISVLELKLFAKMLGISRICTERQHVILDWPLEEVAFSRLITFLPDKQSRGRFEQLISDERVVVRGLGICSGDVQLGKLHMFLQCFCKTAAGFAQRKESLSPDVHLVESLQEVSISTMKGMDKTIRGN